MRKIFFYLSLLTTLSAVSFASCIKHLYPHRQPSEQYVIEQSKPVDSAITAMIAPYKKGVDTQMKVIVGHTDIPLTKAQPECTIGNFMADAQLMAARAIDPKTDAAIANYGGIRLPYIDPGPLTRGKMYELMPFDNVLTIVEIPGTVLKQFCDHMAKGKGWPVSGLSFIIKEKAADSILINGELLNEHHFYKIATSDYIAHGGDNCDFLSSSKKRVTSVFIRDAMIAYVTRLELAGKPLHPNIENRVRYAE